MRQRPVSSAVDGGAGPKSAWLVGWFSVLLFTLPSGSLAQENDECFLCHSDITLQGERGRRTISLYVNETRFAASVHGDLECVSCHMDIAGEEMPHDTPLAPVECGMCHDVEQEQHVESLHGRALARGDPLAPDCNECHGSHYVIRADDPASPVYPLNIPFTCGSCHSEGAPVQRQRDIHQSNIIGNYTESM
ncbi:MAG: cytochrome c3 family protein, partial [Bacteroidota bacterium]